jgi:hypothetical protein
MKCQILTNWTILRMLRLAIGIAILVQAIIAKDILFAFAGLIFTAMPVFNLGSCSAAGSEALPKRHQDKTKDIIYKEVV